MSDDEAKVLSLEDIIDENSPEKPLVWVLGGIAWEFRSPRSYMEARQIDKQARQWGLSAIKLGHNGRIGGDLPEAQAAAVPSDLDLDGAMFAFRIHRLVKTSDGEIGLPEALRILRSASLCEFVEEGLRNAGSRSTIEALALSVAQEKKD